VSSDAASLTDVLIEDELVVAVAAGGSELADAWQAGADRVIDAAGRYVIPGGIDAHTHMEMPFGGTMSADTFETGTRAAAWGGTTMIIDFAIQTKGESLIAGMDTWQAKAADRCAVDYSFHAIISDVNESSLKEMDVLVEQGVTSFKLFMAYPGIFYATDKEIFQAMDRAAGNGALIMMHAENGIAIDAIVASALAKGETDPIFHGLTRPAELEGEAVHRAITLAQVAKAPLYIVHLSSEPALAAVVEARDRGQRSGGGCAPTTSPSWQRTTARSVSPSRRSSASVTSRRSRTGCRASRTEWICSTKALSPARCRCRAGSR
jgi:dihydropyrimidinase